MWVQWVGKVGGGSVGGGSGRVKYVGLIGEGCG